MITAASVVLVACAAVLILGRRRASAPWRGLGAAPHAWATVGVAVLCFALYARPGEYLLGGRDPGIYVAAMGSIARTGGITYVDPAVLSIPAEDLELFYRHPERPDYSWGRFMGFPLERPQTGRVVPEFFHLFPAFGAFLFQAMGARGALAAPVVFGVLGTLAALLALRRLFGPAPALLGALLLALNVLQAWFARYPVSEPMSQFLILSGLLAFALWEERRAQGVRGTGGGAARPLPARAHRQRAAGGPAAGLARPPPRAGRARIAAGLPAGDPVRAARRPRPGPRRVLVAEIPAGDREPSLLEPAPGGMAPGDGARDRGDPRRPSPRPAHSRADSRRIKRRRAPRSPPALVLLALYAYAVRPALSAWAGADGNDPARAMAGAAAALRALDFHRLAAHDAQSLVRLGWFVTPLGLGLGLLGVVIALREWQARYLFPLLTLLTFGLFYFYKIRVYADYYFAMRRFLPVVLPLLLGLAAFALTRLARRPGVAPRRSPPGWPRCWPSLFLRDTLPTPARIASGRAPSASWTTWRAASVPRTS